MEIETIAQRPQASPFDISEDEVIASLRQAPPLADSVDPGEVVFASNWESDRGSRPSAPEIPPWEVNGGELARELDDMWASVDSELSRWLGEGLCPTCHDELPLMVGSQFVSCSRCGGRYETPMHLVGDFAA